jgi:putative DNA methylase
MTHYKDLFTPRQLVALTTFSDLVAEARAKIRADALAADLPNDDAPLGDGGVGARAYAEAVSVYLAFAVDKMTTTNSSICTWQTKPTRLVAAFSRQAVPMVWDYAEANPFGEAAGDYKLAVDSLTRVVENLMPLSVGEVKQRDAAKPFGEEDCFLVSTDPPYYDNIGYADLSDYFYVWQRLSLRDVFADVFSTLLVPKSAELIASPYRFNGIKAAAEQHFESGLLNAFANMKHSILLDYPLTIYYAFKQQELFVREERASTGWEKMLTGLVETGFQIVGTWPIRTELTVALKSSVNALASSIILVCRPCPEDAPLTSRREFVNALRRELPAALREMQSGNIAPVDMAQASIGPGMAVYSRYSKVLEPDGRPLSVRTALQLINQELDAYLAEQEGYIDEDSRFAVAWFEQFGFREGPFGQADVLARAKNTAVDALAHAGVLKSGAGKVQLYHWSELDPGWDPAADKRLTVWEAVHHLIERLNVYGEEGAARLLARLPSDVAAQARQLAYRLYSICERKGWAEHARDYNALVISWGASQEQARAFKEQYQQGRLL